VHCKKGLAIFPSPAGMPLTKLSLAMGGTNLIILGQGEFGMVSGLLAGEGKIANLFFTVWAAKCAK
jgi:hypothetical protein